MRKETTIEKTLTEKEKEHEQLSGVVLALGNDIVGLSEVKKSIEANIEHQKDFLATYIEQVEALKEDIDGLQRRKTLADLEYTSTAESIVPLLAKKDLAMGELRTVEAKTESIRRGLAQEVQAFAQNKAVRDENYKAEESSHLAILHVLKAEIEAKKEYLKQNADMESRRATILEETVKLSDKKAQYLAQIALIENKMVETAKACEFAVDSRRKIEQDTRDAQALLESTEGEVAKRNAQIAEVDAELLEKTRAVTIVDERIEFIKRKKEIDKALEIIK